MSSKGKVLVAMSGGVDSSVAAILLKEQGYELVGVTMKTWDYDSTITAVPETGCCSLDSINDARALAVKLGFPHYVLDLCKVFNQYVITNFVDEYLSGRTPNPCVLCNTHVKWGALLEKAKLLGCDYIATGHYARIQTLDGRYYISKGQDESKDQSYVLWGLSQEYLSKTLFPLGGMLKTEIRELAGSQGFINLAKKRDSYEICFIPDNEYRNFLNYKQPDLPEKLKDGNFITLEGKIIGKHKGFPYYTIGQRKGLNIAVGEPLYVTNIIPETNTVVLGKRDDLLASSMEVKEYNLMKYSSLKNGKELLVKIRYKDKGTIAQVIESDNRLQVKFNEAVSAIAPGQSAVFYEGNDVVGGGVIL